MTEISCPSCGHHLFNTTESAPAPSPRLERPAEEAKDEVLRFVRSHKKGPFLPADLHAEFHEGRDGDEISPRAFGLVLRVHGYRRVAKGGKRFWLIE